jgi:membrane AbrB-like protein
VRRARGLALALAIGALGGAAFYALGLPLAWMLGAMVATTIAAFARAPLADSRRLRAAMSVIFGVFLGSAFTPEIVDRLLHWAGGVVATTIFVGATTLGAFAFFRRVGFDRATSFFSATPGGLGVMTLIGEREGGDIRNIALMHATRILVVVFAIPFWLRYVERLDIPRVASMGGREMADAGDLALVTAIALAGWLLGRLTRLPAAPLIGPMLACAAAYMTGLVHGAPPAAAIVVAQLVMGSGVGARFVGVKASSAWRIIMISAASSAALFAAALGFSVVVAPLLGLSRTALLLAIAPGGLAEMALIAISLHVDLAFVSTMQIVRIMLIVALAPLVFRMLGWGVRKAASTLP